MKLPQCSVPVVLAPMAGGAGTPELTAAVCAASGLGNRLLAELGDAAPEAYPEVHVMTAPLRAEARRREDLEALHLSDDSVPPSRPPGVTATADPAAVVAAW